MSKKDRQLIFDKYNGRCAYCGCELQRGWHVDEIEPVIRGKEYLKDDNGKRIYDEVKGDYKTKATVLYPERFTIENQNPSCPSCNRQKHRMPLESFRESIQYFIQSLNLYHNQYKFAKRYNLIVETGEPVIFYFETLTPQKKAQRVETTPGLMLP